MARIQRECDLAGEEHPNLVSIFDGGECSVTSHLYVSMEKLNPVTIADRLSDIKRCDIRSIMRQLASACLRLEELDMVHRDIKPQNISLGDDDLQVCLLDFGVVRPFLDSDITDVDSKPFIGTLRYSSPEFLLREEKQDKLGFRALTFYQLGAVLHDILMRKPLFSEFSEPYMALGEAVLHETPTIIASDVDPSLVLLARNCLIKNPDERLKVVKWDDFLQEPPAENMAASARERVMRRSLLSALETEPARMNLKVLMQTLCEKIEAIVRKECLGNSAFPRLEILSDESRVTVRFAKDMRLRLTSQVEVRFLSEIGDSESMSVDVNGVALIGYNCGGAADPDSRRRIFIGPLDSLSLDENIADFLYQCIDAAQQRYSKQESISIESIDVEKFG